MTGRRSGRARWIGQAWGGSLLTSLLLLACLPPVRAEIIDRVLATVNARVITLSEARAAVHFGLVEGGQGGEVTPSAVRDLVNRVLMLEDVERYAAPEPAAALIEERLAGVRARFPSADALQLAYRATGTTEARLRGMIRDTLRLEHYIAERFSAIAQPSDEDVARSYEEHAASFTREGRQLSLDEVSDTVRARLLAERRQALVADWVDRLRRRADITDLMSAAR